MTSLAAALADSLATTDRDLVVLADGQWTRHPWQEVLVRAENVAERLTDAEVGAVGLVGEPTVEFIATIAGALLAGIALNVLPTPVRGANPASWARSTEARFALAGVERILTNGDCLAHLSVNAGTVEVEDVADIGSPCRSTTLAARPMAGVAILQSTAGSTGLPRTARLASDAVLANLNGLVARADVTRADIGCSWLPLYHDMGLSFLLSGMLVGAEVWQAPTAAFQASPFQWLRWLTESRASFTAGPNMAYGMLGKYSRRVTDVDLGALRFALNGGEPVDHALTERFVVEMARFGLSPGAMAPSYGMAESVCAVTVPVPGQGLRTDDAGHVLVGTVIDGMELRIDPVDASDVGEICIRGSSMMSGYLDDQRCVDDWFRTGDLGQLTDEGLVVRGRIKEVITVAGRNVFPAELEWQAAKVPGVRAGAVAAFGVGEGSIRPGVVIVAEFRGPDEAGARSAMIARIATECDVVPTDVVLVRPGRLPRTSSGKIRRLDVRRRILDGEGL